MMKNVTITIDEATHRAARLHAAEHGTSISALVKRYLAQLASSSPSTPAVATAQVQENQAAFATPPTAPSKDSKRGAPWMVNGKPVWTPDGKPRQPGALRASGMQAGGDAEDALAAFPPDLLASFAAWDEDAFDPLP